MLSKEVCTRCRRKEFNPSMPDVSRGIRISWLCPIVDQQESGHGIVFRANNPPDNCPYKFEHAVAAGKSEDVMYRDL